MVTLKIKFNILLLVCVPLVSLIPTPSIADIGVVVARFRGCDYFIADGKNGLYVLEWYGGFDPSKGDKIFGKLSNYGIQEVYYPDYDQEGTVWVEDYMESSDGALEEIAEHCD